MFMFYKIDKDYYVLVGRKYVKVEFEVDGNEINAIPTKEVIERNDDIKVISKPYNNDFIKEIIDMSKKKNENNFREENVEEKRTESRKEHTRFGR